MEPTHQILKEWATSSAQVVLIRASQGAQMVRQSCPDRQFWLHLRGAWLESKGQGERRVRCGDVAEYFPATPARRISLETSLSIGVRLFHNAPVTASSGTQTPLATTIWKISSAFLNGEEDAMRLDETLAQRHHSPDIHIPAWLNRTRERIAEEPDRWSLSELADQEEISVGHLTHAFKARFGEPPSAFRKRMKCSRAIEALGRGTAAGAAAQESGFFDQPHLNRSLRELTGFTPNRLQDLIRTLSN